MRYEGVVFDLDHTLFDRYATLKALTPDFCRLFDDVIAVDESKAAEMLIECDKKYIYYGWSKIFEVLCQNGMFKSLPAYERYRDTLLTLFQKHAIPFPFTYSLLDELRSRGLKLGLITNGKGYIQRRKLELLKLTDAFDYPLLCGEFGVQKPDRAPFDHMVKMLGIPAEKLLFVGDNPICDVDASRKAGYTPVEILTTDCTLPDVEAAKLRLNTVESLPALIDLLQQGNGQTEAYCE